MSFNEERFEQAITLLTKEGVKEEDIFKKLKGASAKEIDDFSSQMLGPGAEPQTQEKRADATPGATFTPDAPEAPTIDKPEDLAFTKLGTPIVKDQTQFQTRGSKETGEKLIALQKGIAKTATFGLVEEGMKAIMPEGSSQSFEDLEKEQPLIHGIGEGLGYFLNPLARFIRGAGAIKGAAKLAAAEVGAVEGVTNAAKAVMSDEVSAMDAIKDTALQTVVAGAGTKLLTAAMKPIASAARAAGVALDSKLSPLRWIRSKDLPEESALILNNLKAAPKSKAEAKALAESSGAKIIDMYKGMKVSAEEALAQADDIVRPELEAVRNSIADTLDGASEEALLMAAAGKPEGLAANLYKLGEGLDGIGNVLSHNWRKTTKQIKAALPKDAPKVDVKETSDEIMRALSAKYPADVFMDSGVWKVGPNLPESLSKNLKGIKDLKSLRYDKALDLLEFMQETVNRRSGSEGDAILMQAYNKFKPTLEDVTKYGKAAELFSVRQKSYAAGKDLLKGLRAAGKSMKTAGKTADDTLSIADDPLVQKAPSYLAKINGVAKDVERLADEFGVGALGKENIKLMRSTMDDLRRMHSLKNISTPTKMKRALKLKASGRESVDFDKFIDYRESMKAYDQAIKQADLPKILDDAIKSPLDPVKKKAALDYVKGSPIEAKYKSLLDAKSKWIRLGGGKEVHTVNAAVNKIEQFSELAADEASAMASSISADKNLLKLINDRELAQAFIKADPRLSKYSPQLLGASTGGLGLLGMATTDHDGAIGAGLAALGMWRLLRNPTSAMVFLEKHGSKALVDRYKPISVSVAKTIDTAVRGFASSMGSKEVKEPNQELAQPLNQAGN